jgi:tRNA(fMet)-specific endonuclease VapC
MTVQYLLDTNIVSVVLKGTSQRAVDTLARRARSSVGVSVITELELRFGLEKHPASKRLKAIVDAFLSTVPVFPLPTDLAVIYGRTRRALERAGRPIGPLDTIIAAHAVSLGAVLVTNNMREFGRVAGLRCEDWS